MSSAAVRQGRDVVAVVLLIAATVAAYWSVGSHQFINYDDQAYVTENAHVRSGITLGGIKYAFTTGDTGNWHPLAWISHMIDCQVFGLNPGAHHWMNVAIHAANSVVLFLLLRQMLNRFGIALFVAALFALHPLHVESVAWVAERKDLLCSFFGLLTMWAYVNAVRRPTAIWWALVPVLYGLSLLSKPMLVTLPSALILLDFWPLRRFSISDLKLAALNPKSKNQNPKFLPLILEKRTLFIFAAVSCVITMIVQQRGGAMKLLANVPWHDRWANAAVSYVRYLGKTFWPVDLAVLYPHPGRWPATSVIGAVTILAAISAAAAMLSRKRPYLIVGWLWFIGMLVPVIGLVQVGPQSMADRYTYLPLIGIFLAVACSARDGLGVIGRWRGPVAGACAFVILAVLFVITRRQIAVWLDSETLYEHALQVTDRNWLVHANLGVYFESQGRIGDAADEFDKAVAANSEHAELQFYSARESYKIGRITQAVNGLKRTLALQPDHVEALNLLAWIRATSPDDYHRDGTEAVQLAERAASLDKTGDPRHLDTLAAAYAQAGRFAEAVTVAQAARELTLTRHQTEMVNVFDKRLDLYRQGKPYRDGGPSQ